MVQEGCGDAEEDPGLVVGLVVSTARAFNRKGAKVTQRAQRKSCCDLPMAGSHHLSHV
jgi:hypothetical protein